MYSRFLARRLSAAAGDKTFFLLAFGVLSLIASLLFA
jgi:hypothetical protein